MAGLKFGSNSGLQAAQGLVQTSILQLWSLPAAAVLRDFIQRLSLRHHSRPTESKTQGGDQGCPPQDSCTHSNLRATGGDEGCGPDLTYSFKRFPLAAVQGWVGGTEWVSIPGKRGFRAEMGAIGVE